MAKAVLSLTDDGRSAVVFRVVGTDSLAALLIAYQVILPTRTELVRPATGSVRVCATHEQFARAQHAENAHVVLAIFLEIK